MFKLLMFFMFVTVTSVHSENIEWFTGKWLPVILYSNQYTNKTEEWVGWRFGGWIGLWTGWLLEPQTAGCGWLEVKSTNQRCKCGHRDVPLVQLKDSASLESRDFYEFHMNEPRPIIIVDSVRDVKAGLSEKCKCGDKEMTQLVFRKTNGTYLMTYENKENKKNSPNMTMLMFRHVPTMDEISKLTKSPVRFLNMEYQEPTLMCHPTHFDKSAYIVDDSEDDSPFLTLGDLKYDRAETRLNLTKIQPRTSSASNNARNEAVQSPSSDSFVSSSTRLHPLLGISLLQLVTLICILH